MQALRTFISHSSKDKPFVRELDRALRAFGVQTFLDERDIQIGEWIPRCISTSIEASAHLCVVISKNSAESDWVRQEIATAIPIEEERKTNFILPILLDDTAPPGPLKDRCYADFRSQDAEIDYDGKALLLLLQAIGVNTSEFSAKLVASNFDVLDALVLGSDLAIITDQIERTLDKAFAHADNWDHYSPIREMKRQPLHADGGIISASRGNRLSHYERHQEFVFLAKAHQCILDDLHSEIRYSDFISKAREYGGLLTASALSTLPPGAEQARDMVNGRLGECLSIARDIARLGLDYGSHQNIYNFRNEMKKLGSAISKLNFNLLSLTHKQRSATKGPHPHEALL